ncbi:hypothetical protein BREVNS_1532 [Brevinematales bacterium NS]|nr:hypothetical protein [Brevinematales bacterium]QJR22282.1 hypothetical protein BREVNS_1532 [Brevinematales bacterium NS]
MKRKKIVFISFCVSSTGELSFFLQLSRSIDYEKMDIELYVHSSQKYLVSGFRGEVIDFDWKDGNFTVKEKIFLERNDIDGVIFLDLQASFEEGVFLSEKEIDKIYLFWEKLHKKGVFVGVMDYFTNFEASTLDIENNILKAKQEIDVLFFRLLSNNVKPATLSFLKQYYYRKVEKGIWFLPSYIFAIRPVPFTWPIEEKKEKNVFYVKINMFSSQISNNYSPIEEKKFVIFVLSKFMKFSQTPEDLRKIFYYVLNRLLEFIEVEEVKVIDPIGFIEDGKYGKIDISSYEWVDRNVFNCWLSQAKSVFSFVPYAFTGLYTILKKNYFVAISSSQPSFLIDFKEGALSKPFLKFHAMGIVSDLVFFHRLIEKNPYFDCVGKIDMGDIESYKRVFYDIENGALLSNIERYLSLLEKLSIPDFGELLEVL